MTTVKVPVLSVKLVSPVKVAVIVLMKSAIVTVEVASSIAAKPVVASATVPLKLTISTAV